MVGEYVLARGIRLGLGLEAICERRDLPRKQTGLVEEYWANGVGFEAIPKEIVREYGIADVEATAALYANLIQEYNLPGNTHLKPTVEMMNEYLEVLTDIECNGVKIDLEELARLQSSYQERLVNLDTRLQEIRQSYAGATVVNLDSPQDLSQLIYSRKVLDKNKWKELFNLGTEERGASRKPKRRPRMKNYEFVNAVRSNTQIIRKTTVEQCVTCRGTGKIRKVKKDGSEWKNASHCSACGGCGLIYRETKDIGGFKLSPHSPEDTAAGGFKTDRTQLEYLALETKDPTVKEFLIGLVERNAITTYLSTFIEGIRKHCQSNGYLHGNFLQCVAATGRVASRAPNLHNQPRNKTFPIRGAFIPRFEGGQIIEFDYKGLEYRVAVDMAHDEVGYNDIVTGVDPHLFTASHIDCGRQDAKPHTFAPLYGAMAAGKPDRVGRYYIAFMEKHKGIARYQQELQNEAIANKCIRLPSGREYSFPNATRTRSGGSTGATAIKNYPVQGFATADIVPCGGIRLRREFIKHGFRSLIILTVHDSFVIDYCPEDDYNEVITVSASALRDVIQDIYSRYGYTLWVPIDIEAKAGINWRDGKEISC